VVYTPKKDNRLPREVPQMLRKHIEELHPESKVLKHIIVEIVLFQENKFCAKV
jgi:hypothetical protein